jgi:Na+-transporting NADH:ubiquinone oxidoreductase subunit NqrD/SAM-dependent methyltransferase
MRRMNGQNDPFKNPPHLRPASYLILGATLLLGGTTQFSAAFVLGFCVFSTVTLVSLLLEGLADNLPKSAQFPLALVLATLLTTVYKILLQAWTPEIVQTLGVYLDLTALTPLIPALRSSKTGLASEQVTAAQASLDGLKFWLTLSVFALLREALGSGKLTVWPKIWVFSLPVLNLAPAQSLLESPGAFFLAAALVVLVRLVRRRTPTVAWAKRKAPTTEVFSPTPNVRIPATAFPPKPVSDPAPPSAPKPALSQEHHPADTIAPELPRQTPETRLPESLPAFSVEPPSRDELPLPPTSEAAEKPSPVRDWGENLESVVERVVGEAGDKKRFLVIGCGNGELAWHLAFLALEGRKRHKTAEFRVRGTDPFSARIATAREGIYKEHQLEFIPEALKRDYLLRGRDEERHLLRIAEEPRQFCEFDTADFHEGRLFFYKPADVIVLNQSLEGMSEAKQKQVLATLTENLVQKGTLVVRVDVERSFLPETLHKTGKTVFQKN